MYILNVQLCFPFTDVSHWWKTCLVHIKHKDSSFHRLVPQPWRARWLFLGVINSAIQIMTSARLVQLSQMFHFLGEVRETKNFNFVGRHHETPLLKLKLKLQECRCSSIVIATTASLEWNWSNTCVTNFILLNNKAEIFECYKLIGSEILFKPYLW